MSPAQMTINARTRHSQISVHDTSAICIKHEGVNLPDTSVSRFTLAGISP